MHIPFTGGREKERERRAIERERERGVRMVDSLRNETESVVYITGVNKKLFVSSWESKPLSPFDWGRCVFPSQRDAERHIPSVICRLWGFPKIRFEDVRCVKNLLWSKSQLEHAQTNIHELYNSVVRRASVYRQHGSFCSRLIETNDNSRAMRRDGRAG